MSALTVIADPLRGERATHPLRTGETLAAALMRLWPHGLAGPWRIYREAVNEGNELAAVDLPYHVVVDGETYLLVRGMAGPAYVWTLAELVALNLALTLAAMVFMPKPPYTPKDAPDTLSANNMIAAQGNQLRPGSRVPEMLGTVRAFPDLLCNPVDVYNETNQTIAQMFVLGAGAYSVDDTKSKLGETPLSSIRGADLKTYLPGETIPDFWVLRASREVGQVSLQGESTDSVPVASDTDFIAATKEMRTQEPVPGVGAGRPIRIEGTFFNNGVFWLESVPPASQTTGPYVYVLDGPVVDETGAEASIVSIPSAITFTSNHWFGKASPYNFYTPREQQLMLTYTWPGEDAIPKINDWVEVRIVSTGQKWRGRITYTQWPFGSRGILWGVAMTDLAGNPINFPSLSAKSTTYTSFREPEAGGGGGGGPPPPGGLTNAPTNWYASPLPDPQEIWIDIAFPQGLAFYKGGGRRTLNITVRAEFRRLDSPDMQAYVDFEFSYATAAPMRFTKRVPVSTLGLPAGDPTIMVRLTRLTEYYADASNSQYIQDTQWVRLAAVRLMVGQVYDRTTIQAFTMSNTRSAGAVGDLQLNCIATRILPSWDGSGWTAPAPTRKWADNFVERAMSPEGAFRTEDQLDLAGIYALQAHLESMDAGALGEISMTLDQTQDINAELNAIADVARAVVYRVGRKIFVTRDQANATRVALFNARTKDPDGETVSVRMTGDSDNDCVIVPWWDEFSGWKRREYQYPPDVIPQNPLRLPVQCANWPQAWRRAVFEWNRLQYRRQSLTCRVTEEGRMVRVGDVVNITDDVANLATCAGEVVKAVGDLLTLDRDVPDVAGITSLSILLRDTEGLRTDLVPCTPGAQADQVQLARTPSVEIRGRDAARGTLFAIYRNDQAVTNPWLIVGTRAGGPYVELSAVNYTEILYQGDTAPLPLRPLLEVNP